MRSPDSDRVAVDHVDLAASTVSARVGLTNTTRAIDPLAASSVMRRRLRSIAPTEGRNHLAAGVPKVGETAGLLRCASRTSPGGALSALAPRVAQNRSTASVTAAPIKA